MGLAVEIGLAGALFAGVLTLLSPCSVMLLPAFFACAYGPARTLITRVGVFTIGLLVTLVPLGMFAASLGGFVSAHREALIVGVGLLVIALGIAQLLGLPLPGFSRSGMKDASALSVFVLGCGYGLTGMCAGPLLGTVLAVVIVGGSVVYGALLLAVFALGMVLPLLVLALVWQSVPQARAFVRPRELRLGRVRTTWMGVVSGIFSILVGAFLLLGGADWAGLLPVDRQFRVEVAAKEFAALVPDWSVLLLVVTVIAGAWWAVDRQRR